MLFVGVRAYTRGLTRSLRRATVVTIDRDPLMRFFGPRRHHTVALEELRSLGEAPFDLAVLSGVLGWGADTVDDAERALAATWEVLRPGAILVLGINEERDTTPDLTRVRILGELGEIAPPPFGVHRYVVSSPFEGTHTFLFFERP